MAITPEILLINKEYLVKFTNANASIDQQRIEACIIIAQDLRVEDAIGTDLMDAIKAGDYNDLLDNYVRRAVCWWTYAEILGAVYVKVEEGGLFMRSADNGEQITVEEYTKMRNEAESKARAYTKKLVDYICANPNSFPEYYTSQFPNKSAKGESYQRTRIRISGDKRGHSQRGRDSFI